MSDQLAPVPTADDEHGLDERGDADSLVADGLDARGDDDDIVELAWWQNPVNVVTMLVATLLIAGMLGWIVGRSSNETTGSDVDSGFLWDMRAHHEQAVLMADIYLERPGIDPGLAEDARSIRRGQSIEVGVMVRLLEELGVEPVSEEGTAMAWMDGGVGMLEADMPGMASPAELEELAATSGADADRLFVELMIAHHEGGIHMSEEAERRADNDDVARYAGAWARNQRDEIAELEQLLALDEPESGDPAESGDVADPGAPVSTP